MYEGIKKYRGLIMGLMILWIMFYHSDIYIQNGIVRGFKDLGYGGADVFLLCSGFGIAHSLQKKDVMDFYKTRIRKLYPAYLVFIITYILFQVIVVKDMDVIEMAGAITLTGWWMGYDKQFNWYVPALLMFYIIGPIIYQLLIKAKKHLKCLILIILYALLLCMACISYGDKIMAIGRIPVFAIGIYWGMYLPKEKKMTVKTALTGTILIAIGIFISVFSLKMGGIFEMLGFGVPFLLVAPGICMVVPYMAARLENVKGIKILNRGLEAVGVCSFEIYMIHIAIFKYALYFCENVSNLDWVILYIASLSCGCLYHLIIIKVEKFIEKRKKNEKQNF